MPSWCWRQRTVMKENLYWLSLCYWVSVLSLLFLRCVSSSLPPLLKLDVTNSWICTFLHQNQHAPHHRWVQIWSEHTQNPSAAWWWIGILEPMFMHQAGTLWQMTVNCFSDKSLVGDSTDWGWIELLHGSRGLQKTLSKKADDNSSVIVRDLLTPFCKISHFQLI